MMDQAENSYLSGLPLILSSIALSLAAFLIVLDYSIANVSIPYISGDLGVSTNQGTYVITSFAVGNAIILPITGWLTKRVGLVRLSFLSLLGFVAFSWICGLSQSMTMLVVSRFLQGAFAGPMIPASQSLIISIFPPKKKSAALGIWSTIVVVGPIAGPILGGWISYDYSWPWIFFINIPLGLFAAFVIKHYLKPVETPIEKTPTDWLGLILLAIFVSTLQFTLDKGEQFDWLRSPLIRTMVATSVISFVYLIVWQFIAKNPLLELKLLKVRSYALSIIVLCTQYAMYFGSVVLIPLWLQEFMGYTSTWAGLAVAPLGILPLFFTWAVSKLAAKVGNLFPLSLCLIFFSLASFATSLFTTNIDFFHIALSRLFFGLGILFFVVPLFALAFRDIPQKKLPGATGMFHFVRALSGGIGTAIFTTLWVRRSAFHHSNLTSTILPTNDPANNYYHKLSNLGLGSAQTQEFVNDVTTSQAAMLGLNDVFYLMGWIFIAQLAILYIGKRRKVKAA